ncbi:MAG TPA: ATP-binding protein [Gammaproteobacteria bacterium]|nr:ATP-binding protein [Gammaproteobacteria bacterium]
MSDDWQRLLERAHALLDRLEGLLPPPPPEPDFAAVTAFRWRDGQRGGGFLEPVAHPHGIRLEDLRGIDEQKQALERNTRQFLAGLPANNALLWGSRGTGKSSLVKALLNEHAGDGLRVIEVEKHQLINLPAIVRTLEGRPERFILFCDDLSFEAGESAYKGLKAALDGSVAAAPENALVYATSNRRHLMPEFQQENQQSRMIGGEVHHGETVEEKISLSDRFGLWLSFHPFGQDLYLQAVDHWLERFGMAPTDAATREEIRRRALQWALARGARSGRVAWQFARDAAGRLGLERGR